MKSRLDSYLATHKYASSRSQAEHLIRLGYVTVNDKKITKPGYSVSDAAAVRVTTDQNYVSRAALKLASVSDTLGLELADKTVLDIGSSTGGFTDFVLQKGATKVIAVDVGSQQMHPRLRHDDRVDLHEKTDIREFTTEAALDYILIDVSFISIRKIIPTLRQLCVAHTDIIAMVKPQFEAHSPAMLNKGVVKNNRLRREILQGFEQAVQPHFKLVSHADSKVFGSKGNQERFYRLRLIR